MLRSAQARSRSVMPQSCSRDRLGDRAVPRQIDDPGASIVSKKASGYEKAAIDVRMEMIHHEMVPDDAIGRGGLKAGFHRNDRPAITAGGLVNDLVEFLRGPKSRIEVFGLQVQRLPARGPPPGPGPVHPETPRHRRRGTRRHRDKKGCWSRTLLTSSLTTMGTPRALR